MSARKRTLESFSFELVMTVVAIIALILIIAPSLVVLIVSFTSGFSLRFPPPGYSLRWYVELWNAWQLHLRRRTASSSRCGRRACPSCSASPLRWRSRGRGHCRRGCSIPSSCRRWCSPHWPSALPP